MNGEENKNQLLDTEKYSQLLKKLSFFLDEISERDKKLKEEEYLSKFREMNFWSDEQLISKVNNFKEGDLKKDPTFFRALVDTLIKRAAYSREEE